MPSVDLVKRWASRVVRVPRESFDDHEGGVGTVRLCLDQSRRRWKLRDELLYPADDAFLLEVPPVIGVEVLRIGPLLVPVGHQRLRRRRQPILCP